MALAYRIRGIPPEQTDIQGCRHTETDCYAYNRRYIMLKDQGKYCCLMSRQLLISIFLTAYFIQSKFRFDVFSE